MKHILGDQLDAMLQRTAVDMLRFVKKRVTARKGVVAVFAYALRAALDELSPEERAEWQKLAVAEVQR